MSNSILRQWIARAGGPAILVIAILLALLLIRAMPGDPVDVRLAATGGADNQTRAELRQQLGLNDGPLQQLFRWITGLMRGDLGRSLASDRPIAREIAARLPWSIAIGGGGLAFGVAGGFILALLAAPRGGAARLTSRAAAILGQATPAFGLGLLMIWLFGVQLQWIRPFTGGLTERLALPLLVIALIVCGPISRVALAAFDDARAAPWFTAARAKGLSENATLFRHAGKHAFLASLAGLTPELAWVIGGSAVTEVVFSVPGLGGWVVESIGARDYVALQAYLALAICWVAASHAGVNLARKWLDPRPRPLQ